MTVYVAIRMNNCIILNKLKERDVSRYEIPLKIRRETLILIIRVLIFYEDTLNDRGGSLS